MADNQHYVIDDGQNKIPGYSKEETDAAIAEAVRIDIINTIYPIGSVYLSVTEDTAAKVEAKFGGTWEAFGAGKTLVGVNTADTDFNTVEKTGGEKKHQLLPKEMPDRVIGQMRNSTGAAKAFNGLNAAWANQTCQNLASCGTSLADGYAAGFGVFGYNPEQANQPHNNLQPYITVYMYKRTA